jgi:hypothetical protein
MRFAYIDSNGKEIPIPSVDALALRIELGAITEETQLFDAQADQWGPAHTHEIFHTLARTSGSDDGFVAPPPAPMVALQPTESGEAAHPEPDVAPSEPEEDGHGAELGLALDSDSGLETSLPDDALDLGALDLAPELESGAGDEAAPPMGVAGSPEASVLDEDEPLAPTFDFGGLDGSLELEEAFDPPEASPVSLDVSGMPMDPGPGLETAIEFDSSGFGTDALDSLELEQPMSAFTPEAPPAWMEPEASEPADDAVDLPPPTEEGEASEEEQGSVPHAPRSRPSAPKLRRERSLAGPLTAIVTLVALGVGGYTAWPLLRDRLVGSRGPDEPAVFLPPLDESLVPEMRSAAAGAFARLLADARSTWSSEGGLERLPPDWFAGIYFANASAYPEAAGFWNGMGDWLDVVRAMDVVAFDAAFAAEVAERGATAAADDMRARADSGFVAAGADRDAAYARLQELIVAATRLHEFLLANEANLDHVPATSMTTDPIMEIRSANEAIRTALEDLQTSVTDALVAFGYRNQVTAEGLQGHMLQLLQETGVR